MIQRPQTLLLFLSAILYLCLAFAPIWTLEVNPSTVVLNSTSSVLSNQLDNKTAIENQSSNIYLLCSWRRFIHREYFYVQKQTFANQTNGSKFRNHHFVYAFVHYYCHSIGSKPDYEQGQRTIFMGILSDRCYFTLKFRCQ
jgi:hypothetical protein